MSDAEHFSPHMCWSCYYCAFDLAPYCHICTRDGRKLGSNADVCKPTQCEQWTTTK